LEYRDGVILVLELRGFAAQRLLEHSIKRGLLLHFCEGKTNDENDQAGFLRLALEFGLVDRDFAS